MSNLNEFEIEDDRIMEYFGNGGRVVLPDGVKDIFFEVFENNHLVTELVLPDSITDITAFAFCGCTSLTSITLGAHVTEIGIDAFKNCSSLAVINFKGSKEQWEAIKKPPNFDKGAGNYRVVFDYKDK